MDYAIQNTFTIGEPDRLYVFTNAEIVLNSISATFTVDPVGNELSVDTFKFTVRYDPTAADFVYSPQNTDGLPDVYQTHPGPLYALQTVSGREYMAELPYGTVVNWTCNAGKMAKGYLQSVDRVGKYAWTLTCISGIGLLDNSYHFGGLYTGQTVREIALDIVGGMFPLDVSPSVADLPVYGWLPYDTRRRNLHKLLFATGASLTRAASVDYELGFLSTATPQQIPDSRIALGGSVEYTLPATGAEVVEHNFFITGDEETVTLFENAQTSYADHETIIFDEPIHDLQSTADLEIEQSGVNYAIVNGAGTLTGKPYTHAMRVVSETRESSGPPLIKRVEENALISSANSRNVATRVLAYFASAKAIQAKLQLDRERCGVLYSLNDAFGDPTTGFMKTLNIGVTGVIAAQSTIIEGYSPTGNGNTFKNRLVIDTGSQRTITVTSGIIRVVVIGGGQGGQGGFNGEDGLGGDARIGGDLEYVYVPDTASTSRRLGFLYDHGPDRQKTPRGGAAGEPGKGGKVLIRDLKLPRNSMRLRFTYSLGSGGAGGTGNGGAGHAGGNTSVTVTDVTASAEIAAYSSADGLSGSGFFDVFEQELFAMDGDEGVAGGNGGRTDINSLFSNTGYPGYAGAAVGDYAGGAAGAGYRAVKTYPRYCASGGGGGGAAYGTPGGAGSPGLRDGTHVTGGDGGAGANAIAPTQPAYGWGGGGGNGGGAGGNGGGCDIDNASSSGMVTPGAKGAGGLGSAGGQGGKGCVIVYY